MNAISAAFWWKSGDRKPLYWFSWDKISAYKSEGGLGIRDFRLLNQALLANQCWCNLTNPSLLNSKILLPKYCSRKHLLNVKPNPSSSWAWKSILYGRDLINRHLSWTVGNGASINLYNDQWIPFFPKPLSHVIPYTGSSTLTVSSILTSNSTRTTWNIAKIHDLIPETIIPKILAIQLPSCPTKDRWVWPHTPSGQYSTKSGYRALYDQNKLSSSDPGRQGNPI